MKILVLDKKGQASAQLLFVTFIVLVIFVGMLNLINDEISQTGTAELGKARVSGEKMAGAINAVYTAGSGYSANFTITAGVTTPASTIIVNSTTNTVDVIYKGDKISIKVIPKNLTNFSTNTSTTTDKIITIKNENGKITFQEL